MEGAISAIQSVLKIGEPSLKVDGDLGPATRAAFRAASAVIQRAVVGLADTLGFDVSNLTRSEDRGMWIPQSLAYQYADEASRIAGLDRRVLRWMLDREPEKRVESGLTFYRVDSLSPNKLYKGLFQMGKPGWEDAKKLRAFAHIGSYDNWADGRLNAHAAAGLALMNMKYARDIHGYKGPFTPEIIYAMHNQGHTFISSALSGGMGRYVDGQSTAAKRDLRVASIAVRNSVA